MPTTQYIYLGNQYLCEADETGTLTKRCVNEPGTYTNLVSRKDLTTGETSYPLYDALGSTRTVTDESGAVTDTFVYDAWGNVLDRTGTTEMPFQYVGRHGYYHDAETDLSYVMARIYDPRIVRWLSVDPVNSSIEHYRYAQATPVNVADPLGLQSVESIEFPVAITIPPHHPVRIDLHYEVLSCDLIRDEMCYCNEASDRCWFYFTGVFSPKSAVFQLYHRRSGKCLSDMDRTEDDSHLSVTLKSGTICRLMEKEFDPNTGRVTLPEDCRDVVTMTPREGGQQPLGDLGAKGQIITFSGDIAKVSYKVHLQIECECDDPAARNRPFPEKHKSVWKIKGEYNF